LFELDVGSSVGNVGDSPDTVFFDSEVVATHLDLEETELTPVTTVTVSSDPVFGTIGRAPTNNGDFLVDLGLSKNLREDAALVGFELFSDLHATGDGTILVDSLLHAFDTTDNTVVRDFPVSVFSDVGALVLVLGPRSPGGRHVTVLTKMSTTAGSTNGDLSLVVLAGVFRDTVFVSELVDSQRITTLAVTTSLTVEDNLHSESNVRESVVSGNHDSVSESRSGSFSPAGSTVTGTVGGSSPGKEVSVADVSPVHSLRESFSLDAFESRLTALGGEFVESAVELEAVSLVVGSQRSLTRSALLGGGSLVGVVSNIVGPGVFGDDPVATTFDTDGVGTSGDTEETVLTPELAPRVSD